MIVDTRILGWGKSRPSPGNKKQVAKFDPSNSIKRNEDTVWARDIVLEKLVIVEVEARRTVPGGRGIEKQADEIDILDLP